MTEETFQTAIERYIGAIHALPEPRRSELMKRVEQTRHRQEQIRRGTQRAHDALDDWRLWAKYLLFDAEARRRESPPPQSDPPQTD